MTLDIEDVFAAADEHGEANGDPDYAVGDLQEVLRAAWGLMTPAQRDSLMASSEVANAFECAYEKTAERYEEFMAKAQAAGDPTECPQRRHLVVVEVAGQRVAMLAGAVRPQLVVREIDLSLWDAVKPGWIWRKAGTVGVHVQRQDDGTYMVFEEDGGGRGVEQEYDTFTDAMVAANDLFAHAEAEAVRAA